MGFLQPPAARKSTGKALLAATVSVQSICPEGRAAENSPVCGEQGGRYHHDALSHSLDGSSAAAASASDAQGRGFTFGRLLNQPRMPLQMSRQQPGGSAPDWDAAQTPTFAQDPSGAGSRSRSPSCFARLYAAQISDLLSAASSGLASVDCDDACSCLLRAPYGLQWKFNALVAADRASTMLKHCR